MLLTKSVELHGCYRGLRIKYFKHTPNMLNVLFICECSDAVYTLSLLLH